MGFRQSLRSLTQCRLYLATQLNVPDVSGLYVPWDGVAANESAMWSAALPERITIPAGLAGLWLIKVTICWRGDIVGSDLGGRQLEIVQTPAPVIEDTDTSDSRRAANVPTKHTFQSLAGLYRAKAGDHFRVNVHQNSGSAQALVSSAFAGGTHPCNFSAFLVGS